MTSRMKDTPNGILGTLYVNVCVACVCVQCVMCILMHFNNANNDVVQHKNRQISYNDMAANSAENGENKKKHNNDHRKHNIWKRERKVVGVKRKNRRK